MTALRLPLLLVAGSYLGTISHTLTALHVLAQRNLDIAAVVVSESAGSAATARRHGRHHRPLCRPIDVIGMPRLADAAQAHPAFAAIAQLL